MQFLTPEEAAERRAERQSKSTHVGFWERSVPLWIVLVAFVAVAVSSTLGITKLQKQVDAKQRCPVVSRQDVEETLGFHKPLVEQVNGETCSFVSSFGYPAFGVSRQEDVRGYLFRSLSDDSNDVADVPSSPAARWVPGHKGLYFKANGMLVVINVTDSGVVSDERLLELAGIIAKHT